MRPVPEKKRARKNAVRGDAPDAKTSPATPPATFPAKSLRPIGPAALKALRERIRSGQYPTDEQVQGGLRRMFRSAD